MTTTCQNLRKSSCHTNGHGCLANTKNSDEMLHPRHNTERFAVVLTHLPSLPTHILLAFLSIFHLALPFNSSFRFFSCLLHSFLVPFISSLVLLSLCLLPSPSFSPPRQFPGILNVAAQQSSRKGKPRHQGNLTA